MTRHVSCTEFRDNLARYMDEVSAGPLVAVTASSMALLAITCPPAFVAQAFRQRVACRLNLQGQTKCCAAVSKVMGQAAIEGSTQNSSGRLAHYRRDRLNCSQDRAPMDFIPPVEMGARGVGGQHMMAISITGYSGNPARRKAAE